MSKPRFQIRKIHSWEDVPKQSAAARNGPGAPGNGGLQQNRGQRRVGFDRIVPAAAAFAGQGGVPVAVMAFGPENRGRTGNHDVCPRCLQPVHRRTQVVGKPAIVVIQEGNVFSLGAGDADIVGAGLLAAIEGKIDVANPLVRKRPDQQPGRLRAAIADHDQFPIRKILGAHAADREGKHRRPVVGRKHDRDGGRPFAGLRCLGGARHSRLSGICGVSGGSRQ